MVGAGIAGLVAARDLVAEGREVVVLEARDEVGGRVRNHRLSGGGLAGEAGTVVEVGGQWIGPGQDRMAALVTDLGLETFPTWNEGQHVLHFNRRSGRYRGTIPRLSPLVLADMARTQARFDRLARRVPLDEPWNAPGAAELDGQTMETWVRRHAKTKGARALFALFAEAVFAAEPSDLSLLHALFYTHSGRGVDALTGTRNGAQQDRFVGGSQLLPLALAADLGPRVRLAAPVRRIEQSADAVTVTADIVEVAARHVVVAVPPPLASRIDYSPALPAARDQLTQRLPMGSVIKCHAVYDEPFWRDDGLSGQATSDIGPVKVVFDNSPPSGSPGVLLAFLEGEHARVLGAVSAGERRDAVLGSLARFFGPRAASPVDFIEVDWAAEEWTRGCYAAIFTPGTWTQYGPALREPVGRLHWAGTETATEWCGYMDGAAQSGERVAAEILARS